MPELARRGLLVAEAERQRQAPREGASAQGELARTFDPAIADQGHVRGAAPDVDEDAALGPRLLARASARQRVCLRDGGGQLEDELAHDGVDSLDVGHRRERVEDGDLKTLPRYAHRLSDRVAIDTD